MAATPPPTSRRAAPTSLILALAGAMAAASVAPAVAREGAREGARKGAGEGAREGQPGTLAPLADARGYAPAPPRIVDDHVYCVAGAAGAVYVSDAFAAPPGRAIDLLRSEWSSFMRRRDASTDFADCTHDLPDKDSAYRQRDAAAQAQVRARGLQRVTYTGWIG